MEGDSSSSVLVGMRDENESQIQQQQSASSSSLIKKRRNQPGNPKADAEVVALSPKTLMATNRFICEVCNKGFQREQNLQLHRRGHNLPWKLKQKNSKEVVKRKVYLCPEPTCVHHDPARALGDLTGIKKHYSRKHGEKKYKCDKCSKKYAVQSDWKAHAKTCGTREYRCDCGTLFSRRDSFITHRAFCDALAQESARNLNPSSLSTHLLGFSQMSSTLQDQMSNQQPHDMLRLGGSSNIIRPSPQLETLFARNMGNSSSSSSALFQVERHEEINQSPHGMTMMFQNKAPSSSSLHHGLMHLPQLQASNHNHNNSSSSTASLFNFSFFPNSNTNININTSGIMDTNHHSVGGGDDSTIFSSGNLMSVAMPSLYSTSQHQPVQNQNSSSAHMSATALLQKAAQLGSSSNATGTAAASNSSLLLKTFGQSVNDNDNFGGLVFGDNSHLHHLMMNEQQIHDNVDEDNDPYRELHANDSNKLGSFENHELISCGLDLEQGRLTRDFLGVGEMVRRSHGTNNTTTASSIDNNIISSQGKTSTSTTSHAIVNAFGRGNFQ